jgi:hypothetical protein
MSVVTQINAKVAEAVAAQEAGDYQTALTKLRSAKMLISSTPDARHGEGMLQWERTSIDSMIRDLTRQLSASAGIRRTKVVYKRPGSC